MPGPTEPFALPSLGSVARHATPHLVEATLIPMALFYASLWTVGLGAAFVAGLLWSYGSVGRHVIRRQRVTGILVLGSLGITIRTLTALASGSAFVYFVQPVLGTVAVGVVFLVSAAVGRPLAGRLARDFCPLPEGVADRPGVRRLFRQLTVLWAGVNFAGAAVTLWLLTTQPLTTFVVARVPASMAITSVGIVLTVRWSVRTARAEGLRVHHRRPAPALSLTAANLTAASLTVAGLAVARS